jgi:hypothetical protein
LNVILYPLHLCRKFERRWNSKAVQDECQRPPSRVTDGCNVCGRIAMAPVHSTYLPTGTFVHQWRCPVCRNSWQTSVDPGRGADTQLMRSEHLRNNAENCLTLENTAPNDAARKQLRRMGTAWLDLAETQDWLDGVTPPVSRPQPSAVEFT